MAWEPVLKHALPMYKIDAHQHFWQFDPVRDSWIDDAMAVIRKDFSFVPICIGAGGFEVPAELGEVLASVIAQQSEPVLIIASSDMNHYESDVITRVKDHRAIERILSLDARGLHDVVSQQDISMCGLGPAVVMLTAARQLGAKSAELVKYATSGDVSGDRNMVVGYAGVVVV